ncbi:hypothetical protein CSB45_07365 [candidate division KSB3 bacterium]|uniref:Uncharacterized protein n=1 Tax=candidate division KSB3 bacterium TaxID=2044937 RepID=A0A2G6E5W8_9BACT|nr:MAG: hypothetical protein CSB45_07365 [candidate division KSB3 bacterium]PIE29855.1 MAG: hypothetical protein CSA57_06070 [candidate division KSB3 bacterium]
MHPSPVGKISDYHIATSAHNRVFQDAMTRNSGDNYSEARALCQISQRVAKTTVTADIIAWT